MTVKWNKYDYIILICFASIAWGSLEILHAFLPIRIIGLYGFFHFLLTSRREFSILKKWRLIFSIWIVFVLFSVLWTPDINTALLQAIHLFLIYGVFLLLQDCSIKAHHPLQSIILGWSTMVAITMPIALWEISSGNHLPSGSANEGITLSIGLMRNFAAVTFGNMNSYSVVLCYSLPFLLMSWMIKIPLQKIIWVLSIVVFGIIIINASRGCVLCMIITIFIFLIVNVIHKSSIKKTLGLIVFIGFSVWFAIDYLEIDLFLQLLDRFDSMGLESSRESVYKAGFKIAEDSFFLGRGVASTIPLLKKNPTGLNVLVTHNFFLEILIEYGILFFLLIFGRFYLSTIKIIKSKISEYRYLGACILLTSPLLFVIDDYYSGESAVWMYIFSVMLLETICYNRKLC